MYKPHFFHKIEAKNQGCGCVELLKNLTNIHKTSKNTITNISVVCQQGEPKAQPD